MSIYDIVYNSGLIEKIEEYGYDVGADLDELSTSDPDGTYTLDNGNEIKTYIVTIENQLYAICCEFDSNYEFISVNQIHKVKLISKYVTIS